MSEELERETGRGFTFGTVHIMLVRPEEKGFVQSELGGATQERGGRRKHLFIIRAAGKQALLEVQQLRSQPWGFVPPQALNLSGL